jgi:hypothetical protein
MSVSDSYHPIAGRQVHDRRLHVYAEQLLVLAAEVLRDRSPRTAVLADGLSATAVPTALNASRDERHAATLAVSPRIGSGVAVSHTRGVSLLLRGPAELERIAIDVERATPERPRLAGRIRSKLEAEALPLDAPWADVLRCFCAKEAAFKALAKGEQTGLTFRRLALDRPRPDGLAWVRRVSGEIVAETCVVADKVFVIAVAKPVR